MYLAIDVGGTKTLVACFTNSGELREQVRFATPKEYPEFITQLQEMIFGLSTQDFKGACIAIPGKIDRKNGIGLAFGNLAWKNIPIKKDLQKIIACPISVENDANLAGLSEAFNVRNDFKKVLYVTISTGIGTGIIINGIIDPDFADSEPGQMKVQYNDRLQEWEEIASGSSIKRRYGKIAADINDKQTWKEICHRIAIGLNALIATIQPEVIIFGGGVGTHFKKYQTILKQELDKYSTPLTPVPALRQATHAEQAVIYGCYYLAKEHYETSRSS
jgi:glucokinase